MPVTPISRYDYQARAAVAPGVLFDPKKDKSLTNQADMESADINKIMARYEKTGVLLDPVLNEYREPTFGDFSEIKDYHATLSAVRRAEQVFAALPANVRNRFKNDPQEMINFLEDSKNDKEAVDLGLKDPKVLPVAKPEDTKAGALPVGTPPVPAKPEPAPPPAG